MKIVIIEKNELFKNAIIDNLSKIENVEITNNYDFFENEIEKADLIIFDINSNNYNETITKIENIINKYPNTKFIATSTEINSELVSKITAQGISEFLLKPIMPMLLEASIKKLFSNGNMQAKTMCVFSNKGGVGKTTFATNLAYEIHQKTNEKICILDISFSSDDALSFLNLEQKYNLNDILANIENSKEDTILQMLPKYEDKNIYIIKAEDEITSNIKLTPQKITKVISLLKNIFNYIIIDTTSTINELNVAIFSTSDIILFLSTTSQTSIKNTLKCYELFDKIGYNNDKIKLILNRFIDNQETLETNREVFAKIPNNYLTLIDAINQGKCVSELNPQSNIAKAYTRIANEILNIDFSNLNSKANYNHGIFNLLQKMGDE